MEFVGGLVRQIGVAIAIIGFGIWIGTVLYRFGIIFGVQKFQGIAFLIGFYARAAGMLGIMAVLTGGIIAGTTPWPWLIAELVLGAPSLALLLVRPVREDAFKIDRAHPRQALTLVGASQARSEHIPSVHSSPT